MRRISILSALPCLYFSPAIAQELAQDLPIITVTSGVERQVSHSYFCSTPQQVPHYLVLENPQHGTLNVKEFPSGSPCGGRMTRLFYTSQPGYKGSDRIAYKILFVQRGNGGGSAESHTQNIVVK
jgi:hypothetical protein